ncbi:hypothetical protein [Actinoplanes palleronii]|uniref:hypothetical protein n=1 Tax=Actinoplanes palleronii TaxID=113570 RepID=UPI0019415AA3|nr:hypothetical protein [Actinoplanes palleronii]
MTTGEPHGDRGGCAGQHLAAETAALPVVGDVDPGEISGVVSDSAVGVRGMG